MPFTSDWLSICGKIQQFWCEWWIPAYRDSEGWCVYSTIYLISTRMEIIPIMNQEFTGGKLYITSHNIVTECIHMTRNRGLNKAYNIIRYIKEESRGFTYGCVLKIIK